MKTEFNSLPLYSPLSHEQDEQEAFIGGARGTVSSDGKSERYYAAIMDDTLPNDEWLAGYVREYFALVGIKHG